LWFVLASVNDRGIPVRKAGPPSLHLVLRCHGLLRRFIAAREFFTIPANKWPQFNSRTAFAMKLKRVPQSANFAQSKAVLRAFEQVAVAVVKK